jgi:septal ring factor EnvC (AmiA/AmiB activator)
MSFFFDLFMQLIGIIIYLVCLLVYYVGLPLGLFILVLLVLYYLLSPGERAFRKQKREIAKQLKDIGQKIYESEKEIEKSQRELEKTQYEMNELALKIKLLDEDDNITLRCSNLNLTSNQLDKLLKAKRAADDYETYERTTAIIKLDNNQSIITISKELNIKEDTLQDWLDKYKKGGITELLK